MSLSAPSLSKRNEGFAAAVTDLVAMQAARSPLRVAMAWQGGDAWTYAELAGKVDAIARSLIGRGVGRGDLVGVSMPRRPEMVAAVLGVMRAGAAYVALDPAFPAERLLYMADHAGIRHALVWRDDDVQFELGGDDAFVALDGFDFESVPARELPCLNGDDLAYVLYTSGSTGKPKGVRILQRNLVNFLTSMRQAPGIDANDVLCAVTTLSFDIAALEMYLPLLVGARVVIATEDEQVDPDAFAAVLRDHAVTMLQTTPTLLRLLLGIGRSHEIRGIKLLIGGEAMPRELAEAVLPECRELWNLYGPTETTVWSTLQRVNHASGPVPLGKPIANTTIHVLDESLAPVAHGAIGEIWIGGAGVADGYLNDPARTAERFVPNPFAPDGSPMYRTGDLGSLRDDVLYFHGRSDDQIKLRGYRIEPGDIEAAALSEPGVEQAVAIAKELDSGDRRLILYVTAASDHKLVARLRATLRARLPVYMRPQHVEILAALPRTPNGKIDRKALPLPTALAGHGGTSAATAPDSLETALTAIWRLLLKVNEIGRDDDFFDLGGDSLLAVRVFERMQALTGVNLPLATLLTAPTIAQQAAAFRAAGARAPAATVPVSVVRDDPWSPLVAIQPHGTRPPLFLIHALGGNVLNYVPLARGLDAEQPVYGIQAIGLDGVAPPVGSLTLMAACYVAEMQRLQPRGPYFLAGGSMGGMIAYEIAQQLREQGESVGLLVMMDTYGPGYAKVVFTPRIPLPLRILATFIERPRRLIDSMRVHRARAAGRALPHSLRGREIERVHHRALLDYRPLPYTGRLVLFRGSEQPTTTEHLRSLGWSDYVQGGIEVIELPGNHDNLIEQPALLSKLRAILVEAQALSGSQSTTPASS